jgi:hypothetical protein
MIRVEYDSDDLSGQFQCPFCGQVIKLVGNVHTYRDQDGVERTYPDARNAIHSHFHYDENSFIDECSAIGKVDDTTWEAVEKQTNRIVARGLVVVEVGPHSRGPIRVTQDEPK